MNNRKTKNKRGKKPRAERAQLIPEAKTLRVKLEDKKRGETEVEVDNPAYGTKRRIIHKNI